MNKMPHPNSRLTENQKEEIRQRFANGELRKNLAYDFKVSEVTISRVLGRKSLGKPTRKDMAA